MDLLTLSPEEWTVVRPSLRAATAATLVSLPFGVAIAMALARGRFWGHTLLDGLVRPWRAPSTSALSTSYPFPRGMASRGTPIV
jgi:ABC-type sulfate transport system permease component